MSTTTTLQNSRVTYEQLSGAQLDFTLEFPYLNESHISVSVQTGAGNPFVLLPTSSWEFTSSSIIHMLIDMTSITGVYILRTTPVDVPLVTFQPGSITSALLNLSKLQSLFVVQEARDDASGLTPEGFFNTQDVTFSRTSGPRIGAYPANPLIATLLGVSGPQISEQTTLYPRINNSGPGAAVGWTHQYMRAYIGGTQHTSVPNGFYASMVHDVASPNHPDPNIGGIGADVVGLADGRATGGNMSLVGGGSYVYTGPTGMYYNISGDERDVGGNFAVAPGMDVSTPTARDLVRRAAANPARAAYSACSMGIQQGGDEASDSALEILQIPQLSGGYQSAYPGLEGFRTGISVHNGSTADKNYAQPICTEGGMWRASAYTVGWTQKYGIDWRAVTFTDVVFATQYNVLYESIATFQHPDHIIKVGAPASNSNPRILFVTGPNNTNSDSGMFGVSGSGGTVDNQGTLAFLGAKQQFQGALVPATPNTGAVGLPAAPFASAAFQVAPTITSDLTNKANIAELTQKHFDFWMRLKAISYTVADRDVPEETTEIVSKRPTGRKLHQPITDEAGKPVMATGKYKGAVPEPLVHVVDEMEDTIVPVITPAYKLTYARLHISWGAQQVLQALKDSGMEEGTEEFRTVWALFAYEPEAINADGSKGTCMLRHSEFTPISQYVDVKLYAMITKLAAAVGHTEALNVF